MFVSDNWNPGPRRGKDRAIEKQVEGKWYVITLQEAIDYVDHELFTSRSHVTHHGGCALLFNKDTFYPDAEVKSIYLHDTRRDLPDQVMEGDQEWVMQGSLSRASFRRAPKNLSGQKTFTVLSLHFRNIYDQSSGIGSAVMLGELCTWLRAISTVLCGDATIETTSVLFRKPLLTAPRPAPLWRPGSIPGCRADVCGFLKPPKSDRYWKVRLPRCLFHSS